MKEKKIPEQKITLSLIFGELQKIHGRFDVVDRKFDEHDRRFDTIDKKFDEIDKKFLIVDQRFDAIDQKFTAIDQRFDAIDKKFIAIDQKFNDLTHIMIEGFERLENMIGGAHEKITTQGKEISDRDKAIEKIENKQRGLLSNLDETVLRSDFTTLEKRVATLEER